MSSSDSGSLISSSLPISELIKHIRHSFRERDFNDVQKILMDRENDMKIEMQNQIRDRDSAKEEVCLLERNLDLAELERLKLEEKLQKCQRKCQELEETVTRLLEEKRVSNDREKRAEERCDKIFAENLKMTNEKHKLIFELNEKIKELKNKNSENERLVGVYQEKYKRSDTLVVKMGEEIWDLRQEKLAVVKSKTVEELGLNQLEGDQVMEELKFEGNKTMKVGDLADLVNDEGANLEYPDFKDNSENGSTPDDAEDVAVLLPGVLSASNSSRSRSNGLSKKGDRNLVQSRTRKGDAHTIKTSPCSQSGRNPPQAESNGRKEPLGSGAHASGTRLISVAGCFSKTVRSFSAGGDIIQIIDSDDEANPDGGAAYISKGGVGLNEINFVRSPSSSKRNRTDCMEDLFANSTSKRKRNSTCTGDEDNVLIQEKENEVVKSSHDRTDCSSSRSCGEEAGPASDSQTPLHKLNGLNDEVSTDSEDESYTDSRMEDFVASLRSEKLGRKFTYEADMLRAFQQDEQLCMNAVCALYRQQTKSKGRSNLSKNGGFSPVDSMSGCALAEYLIDGDKELRLRKSVSEVKKQRPDAIGQCRKLANIYVEKLFAIYCAGEDPFFGQ